MVSAIDCTCTEFTGSGSDATAASRAIFMMLRVSGGNDAFEKSFISCPIVTDSCMTLRVDGIRQLSQVKNMRTIEVVTHRL